MQSVIRLYLKSQNPFKMLFKLKLCSFVSVPSLFKNEISALISSVLNNLLVLVIACFLGQFGINSPS